MSDEKPQEQKPKTPRVLRPMYTLALEESDLVMAGECLAGLSDEERERYAAATEYQSRIKYIAEVAIGSAAERALADWRVKTAKDQEDARLAAERERLLAEQHAAQQVIDRNAALLEDLKVVVGH